MNFQNQVNIHLSDNSLDDSARYLLKYSTTDPDTSNPKVNINVVSLSKVIFMRFLTRRAVVKNRFGLATL